MKTKTKRVIPLFLFLMLVLMFFSINASAAVVPWSYIQDFNDTALGTETFEDTIGAFTFNMTKKYVGGNGVWEVSNNGIASSYGIKSLGDGSGYGRGWFNYTYNSNSWIQAYYMKIYIKSGTDEIPFYMYARNGSTNIIEMGCSIGNRSLYYYDSSAVIHHMQVLNFDTWYTVGFYFRSGSEIVYFTNETEVSGTPRNVLSIPRITQCYFDSTIGNNEGAYFDEIHIFTGEQLALPDIYETDPIFGGTSSLADSIEDTSSTSFFGDYSDEGWEYVVAFVACLCIGCFAGFITMNGTAFATGFLGALVFFSLPNHPFQVFGLEVLAIVGFLLVILFVFLLIKR